MRDPVGYLSGHRFPGVGQGLLQPQRNLFFLSVEVKDLHFYPVSDREFLRRMPNSAPGDIRDMEKTIHSTQIDKRTIVGEILHRPLDNRPLLRDSLRSPLSTACAPLREEYAGRGRYYSASD